MKWIESRTDWHDISATGGWIQLDWSKLSTDLMWTGRTEYRVDVILDSFKLLPLLVLHLVVSIFYEVDIKKKK